MDFKIDSGFDELCFRLGHFELSHVMLMNNAEIPWFLLIPETLEVDLCDLTPQNQTLLLNELNVMSLFIRRHFEIDKLNIACNGNVIRQMHWHVIGRRFDDYCWPDVVWGKEAPSSYNQSEVDKIAKLLKNDASLVTSGYCGD